MTEEEITPEEMTEEERVKATAEAVERENELARKAEAEITPVDEGVE